MNETQKIRILISDNLVVLNHEGRDISPVGKNSRAIMFFISISDGYVVNRKMLQDTLWSDRGPEQQSSSLRQALAEIRRSLGSCHDVLFSDRRYAGFSSELVEVQFPSKVSSLERLVENLDIRDEAFKSKVSEIKSSLLENLLNAAEGKSRLIAHCENAGQVGTLHTHEHMLPYIVGKIVREQ